jgi:hypothetical protein
VANKDWSGSSEGATVTDDLDVPAGWGTPSKEALSDAKQTALQALADSGEHPVFRRLSSYYETAGKYAGSSFADLEPVVPFDMTPTDFYAVRLLRVDVKAAAARRFLNEGDARTLVTRALSELSLEVDLAAAGAGTLARMESFYSTVKKTLSDPCVNVPHSWVVASKLCARKRPALFPVRDNKVCKLLNLQPRSRRSNYQVDWQVFRYLIRDTEVTGAVDAARSQIEELSSGYSVDLSQLRVLDAALWTYAVR